MVVVKWILLFAIIGGAVWLTIDTTIWAVKRFKKKKLAKKVHENMVDNNDKQ